jgi:hypothetical protein
MQSSASSKRIAAFIIARASRAGAITEADDAGVDFKKIQDFATHTDATSTERYRRRRERANAEVAKARAEHRKTAGEGGGDDGA